MEAFKKGAFDLRIDGNPRNWFQGYQHLSPGQASLIQKNVPNKTAERIRGHPKGE